MCTIFVCWLHPVVQFCSLCLQQGDIASREWISLPIPASSVGLETAACLPVERRDETVVHYFLKGRLPLCLVFPVCVEP